jgi:hypothetical protein
MDYLFISRDEQLAIKKKSNKIISNNYLTYSAILIAKSKFKESRS